MQFKVARRSRGGWYRVTINPSGTMFFSHIFLTNEGIEGPAYLRLAYDEEGGSIAFEIIPADSEELNHIPESELVKLSYSNRERNSARATLGHLLARFDIKIEDIVGSYEEDRIEGPIEIEGFSDHGFILHTRPGDEDKPLNSKERIEK